MIRVHKPAEPPKVLRAKGASALRTMKSAYARMPRSYASGKKSFEFDSGIYGHASVKEALRKAQSSKCAFCESNFAHISYGDVEHFRPKAGWRQTEKAPLGRPGYYWLAYEWTNLFLSCTLCNQQFKKNLFPLRTPTRRAHHHGEDVAAEAPLLIDPAADDPEALISFRQEVPYAVDGNKRGETTIRTLGLQRPELAEQRRKHLSLVKALRSLIAIGGPEAEESWEQLQRMRQDSEEYAAMTRAFLR